MPFPILESLELRHRDIDILRLPATFIKASASHLQYLTVDFVFLASISRFLRSTTALVDLSFGNWHRLWPVTEGVAPRVSANHAVTAQPQARNIMCSISNLRHPTNLEVIVPVSEPACFHYYGMSVFLNTLTAGFTVSSLQDLRIRLVNEITFPISHLPLFIDDVEKTYHLVQLVISASYCWVEFGHVIRMVAFCRQCTIN